MTGGADKMSQFKVRDLLLGQERAVVWGTQSFSQNALTGQGISKEQIRLKVDI